MRETKYLIVGSSHAALEALTAIRMHDAEGALALVTRDRYLPYSPTILPYVVSGRSAPERVMLRDEAFFAEKRAQYVCGETLVGVDPKEHVALFASGAAWRYEKLLLATGGRPVVPPIAGLDAVPFHVLRTLDDAVGLRDAIAKGGRAIVVGAGLVGMHAAENLVKAGLDVTVVELSPRVLAAYFDPHASGLIERAFADRGVRMVLGRSAKSAARGASCPVVLTLDDGQALEADLLVVAVGVAPEMGYLDGSGIATDRGILVDDLMRTSAPDVWAAGDVTQAKLFHDGAKGVVGILPGAVEQGRIAGADMAGDKVKPYPGSVPLNTYTFFGQRGIAVGRAADEGDGLEVAETTGLPKGGYRRIVLKDNRLWGVSGINVPLDAGVLWQLILRGVDLGPVKADFLAQPCETGRRLMSQIWR